MFISSSMFVHFFLNVAIHLIMILLCRCIFNRKTTSKLR
jgi:hypothetical protein